MALQEPLPEGTTFSHGLTANDTGFGIIGGEPTEYLKADGSGQGNPITDAQIQGVLSAPHTFTSYEVSVGYAEIPVVWSTPFSNAIYFVAFSCIHSLDDATYDVMPADIYAGSITETGFIAGVYLISDPDVVGSTCVISAIGIGTPGD